MGFAVLGGLAQGGRAILQATGIIRGAIQGVLAIWTRGFALVGGFRRSVHGDMPVYGTLTRDPADIAAAGGRGEDMSWAWTELEVHIPLDSGETSLRAAAMLANNGTEFLHIATTYRDSVPRHKLYYRRAHPNELGADYNDDENGSVHHARAIAVGDTLTPGEPGGSSKRAEVNNQGTVMDYLWRYENKQGWTDLHNSAKTFDQDAARISTTWMQQQEAEAICSTVIWKSKPDPNVQGFGGAVDAGIMAFGWNNKPYGFNGRAGKWVDSCQWQGE
ncbi:hypothetical protein GE09DRAFT_72452 [Coniochaeta sp. 2T2.1]|nr:hypothetical protein GE09DRAFT_72452 [Coniochaeta sp. 2T2.1]